MISCLSTNSISTSYLASHVAQQVRHHGTGVHQSNTEVDAAKQLLERLLTDHLPVHTQARTLEPHACLRTAVTRTVSMRSSNMKGDHGLLQLNDQADMAKTSKAFRICVYAQDCCQIYLIV